jgi:hypothetical protein
MPRDKCVLYSRLKIQDERLPSYLGCRRVRRRSASEVESTPFYATADLCNYSFDEKSGKNQRPEQLRGQIFQSRDLAFITIL